MSACPTALTHHIFTSITPLLLLTSGYAGDIAEVSAAPDVAVDHISAKVDLGVGGCKR